MAANNKCVAITKNNTACKSKHCKNSIFCGIHKKNNPKIVIVKFSEDIDIEIKKRIDLKAEKEPCIYYFDFTEEDEYLEKNKTTQEYIIKIFKEQINKEKAEIEFKINVINSITNCKVCCDEIPNKDLIRCSNVDCENKHLVCHDCTLGHINSLMTDGIGSNICMFDKNEKCGGSYKNSDIAKVIEKPEILEKWNELIDIADILKLASICDDYLICPLCCKWGCIFEVPAGISGRFYISCGRCKEQWCNICKRRAHGNSSCYQLNFSNDENEKRKEEIIDHMIQEIITKTLTHCCSSCGCAYIKEEGCNLMMCPNCDGLSCYICGMRLYIKNNTKYWHFSGHELSDPNATCELWNNVAGDGKEAQGNTEYNKNAVEKEIKKFVNSNTPEIKKLICKRIIILFDKDKEYSELIKNFSNIILKINYQN